MQNQLTGLLQRAANAFQSGDFNSALRLSEEVLRAVPAHPEGEHLRALALGRLGRVDEALKSFERAAAQHPQAHAVLSNQGNVLRAVGRLDEAIVAFERSIAANDHFTPAWTSLGIVSKMAGQEEKAEQAFRKVVALEPNDAGALNNLGVLLADRGKHHEAADLFSSALKLQPGMVSALVNRGAAWRNLGNVEQALEDHRRGVSLAPQMAEAYYQLANSLLRARDSTGAEEAFQQALAIEPIRADIHRDYARMLWEFGRTDDFLAPLDAALARQSAPELLVLKGELAFRSGQLALAADAANKALSLNTSDASALSLLGNVCRREAQFEEAIQFAARAHALRPKDFNVLHEFVEILMVAGEFDRAVTLLAITPPSAYLQKHIALKAIALRAAGSESYKELYDYERCTAANFIEVPEGYSSLAAFNAALLEAIRPLHGSKQQPLDQTLYGGTQSVGRLWEEPHSAIESLKGALLAAAKAYVHNLPDDPDHPFLSRKSENLACTGAWSVMLASGGGHVDHIHPEGWVSAVYYVRVPEEVSVSEKAGFLRLGASGVDGLPMEAERWIKPQEGMVVFFPSYIWHGVEKFDAPSQRVTAPFDLAPALTTS